MAGILAILIIFIVHCEETYTILYSNNEMQLRKILKGLIQEIRDECIKYFVNLFNFHNLI